MSTEKLIEAETLARVNKDQSLTESGFGAVVVHSEQALLAFVTAICARHLKVDELASQV